MYTVKYLVFFSFPDESMKRAELLRNWSMENAILGEMQGLLARTQLEKSEKLGSRELLITYLELRIIATVKYGTMMVKDRALLIIVSPSIMHLSIKQRAL